MSATVSVAWHVFGIAMLSLTMKQIAQEPAEEWAARATSALRQNMAEIAKRYGMVVTGVSLAFALAGIATLAIGIVRSL